MTCLTYEREKSTQAALEAFKKEIERLNLFCEVKKTSGQFKSATCFLYDKKNHLVDVGYGKGIDLQSEVSAKFEALEHCLSTKYSQIFDHTQYYSFNEIANDLTTINKKYLEMLLDDTNKNKKTYWNTLISCKGDTLFKVPYFLINPDYYLNPNDEIDYSKLRIKCSNSGTAVGLSFEEAALHAINELIEKDALSCFLLSSFVRKVPKKIKIVDKQKVSNNSDILNFLESTFDEEILIIDITSDIGLPTYCATFTKQNHEIQPIGFGASSSRNYAVQRALLEALQTYHLYQNHPLNLDMDQEYRRILERFRNWPALHKCAKFEISNDLQNDAETTMISEETNVNCDVKDLYAQTIDLLETNSLSVFYSICFKSHNVYCIRAIIPQLEYFHMVRYGKFILPGERGAKILLSR